MAAQGTRLWGKALNQFSLHPHSLMQRKEIWKYTEGKKKVWWLFWLVGCLLLLFVLKKVAATMGASEGLQNKANLC